MASGYEKADCGVDPSNGWGKPGWMDSAIPAAFALVQIAGYAYLIYKSLY